MKLHLSELRCCGIIKMLVAYAVAAGVLILDPFVAQADQQPQFIIDSDNICGFVSLAGDNWRPEDEIDSRARIEAKVLSGDGIAVANLSPGSASIPFCDLYPHAYHCEWHFADREAALSKYRNVLAQLQACVSESDMWADSDLHPQTCTTRLLPVSLIREGVPTKDQDTPPLNTLLQRTAEGYYSTPITPRLSGKSIEGMILHHHGSDEAVSVTLDLSQTSVVGGFNPEPTIHSFLTRLGIFWVQYEDIDADVCADYLQRRKEELERIKELRN